MPELKWDETDFLDCLEVFPIVEEYEISYFYEVKKHELVLDVYVWPYESYIIFSLRQSADAEPHIKYGFILRDEVVYVNDKRGTYLEFRGCFFTSYRSWYNDYTKEEFETKSGLTIQISIKPQIQIRFV